MLMKLPFPLKAKTNLFTELKSCLGAGCSSVDSVPAFEAVGRRIDLLSGPSCSLGYFPFQPVVHNWFIKGRGMYCSVYGKVHIKDPLLLIEKNSLCGDSGFPSKNVST